MSKKMINWWHMKAKKQGVCSETGKIINIGDLILYPTGGRTAYHESSNMYKEFNNGADTGHKNCGC